ncbi:MAG: tripartite tricarboxylate transporter substrate binding protein [Proteobacteria bacterium]|nr:tripartite tricarboxylate transporter substrate binding protein [Pseudomonadota bacterium]
MKNTIRLLVMFIGALTFAVPSLIADYPTRSITYQIPFNPGGQSDVEARRQQPRLEKILGQKVIIQYKPGGGGSIGWSNLVKQRSNGYFMSGINIPHIILQPLARGNAGYKTEQLVPVAFFQATPIGLAVMKDSPFKSLEDFVAYAKKNPGAITTAGSGTWSGHHIAYLQFQKAAGVKLTYVPYKGASPSVAAFLGKHVTALWANSNDLYQHRDKIRILAFGTEKPFEPIPSVPTFKSKGYEILASIDRGVGVPPGTPNEVVKTLESAFLSISQDSAVRKQMLEAGFVPLSLNAKESAAYIRKKVEEWAPVVKEFKK